MRHTGGERPRWRGEGGGPASPAGGPVGIGAPGPGGASGLPAGGPATGATAPAVARASPALAATITAVLMVLPLPLLGQEIPVGEGVGYGRPESERELGWRGSADLGFTYTEGNSETSNLSVAGRLVHKAPVQRWTFSLSFLRASADGEETANRGETSAKYDYFPAPRFFFFGRGAASFNEPAGLDLRLAPAVGAGYQLVTTGRTSLSGEAGVSWIRDAFADGTSDEAVHAVVSESFTLAVSETTDLEQSLSYQPKAADFGDFLLAGEASLTTMISDAVGLKVTVRDEFDSEPFVDPGTGVQREENDFTFVTGVTYSF